MKLYFIKKQIRARNPVEALKHESKAEITDVWVEKEQQPEQGASVIGFQHFEEYEDEQ